MKLNLTRDKVIGNSGNEPLGYSKLREDWLTLFDAVQKQTDLIEKLEKALKRLDEYCPACGKVHAEQHSDGCIVGLALSAVDAWRKEEK